MYNKQALIDTIITNNGCELSNGTHDMAHLLAQAYDVMTTYELLDGKYGIGDLRTSILECFLPHPDYYGTMDDAVAGNNSLFTCQYYGRVFLIKYLHGDLATSPHDVWSACEDYFNSFAPEGFYFGTTEGDGACFGWFKYETGEE
jgi:hypothetical protein